MKCDTILSHHGKKKSLLYSSNHKCPYERCIDNVCIVLGVQNQWFVISCKSICDQDSRNRKYKKNVRFCKTLNVVEILLACLYRDFPCHCVIWITGSIIWLYVRKIICTCPSIGVRHTQMFDVIPMYEVFY